MHRLQKSNDPTHLVTSLVPDPVSETGHHDLFPSLSHDHAHDSVPGLVLHDPFHGHHLAPFPHDHGHGHDHAVSQNHVHDHGLFHHLLSPFHVHALGHAHDPSPHLSPSLAHDPSHAYLAFQAPCKQIMIE